MTVQIPTVSREQVLAYRIAAQELHRVDVPPAKLAVLDLGVQDTPYGSAQTALAVRTTRPLDDPSLRLVWSIRGAPHLHRARDLARLASALWPVSDADAAGRIAGPIGTGRSLGLAAFDQTARAFREVVQQPMTKGEASTEVSARVNPSLTYDCRPCRTRHISNLLFQQAGLAGGVQLQVSGRVTRLAPLTEPVAVPDACANVQSLILAYLRLLGPATPGEVAKFLGTSHAHLRSWWPKDLAAVQVAGRRMWLPADRLDALRAAEPVRLVRLLPPSDPFLQARDRGIVVPDKARQSMVWRALNSPGALLVNGEVTGIWRSRAGGTKLSVAPFDTLSSRVRSAVQAEATRLAEARGLKAVEVTFDHP